MFDFIYPETKVAMEAAYEAGKAVLEMYNCDFSAMVKEDKSPLTLADLKSNEIIIKHLSKTGHYILSEELADNLERLNRSKLWIIDPIDGTKEFINKTGEFSIMIALVEDNQPVIGLVYQPTLDKLFLAEKGNGAFKIEKGQWHKLRTSNNQNIRHWKAVVSRHHLGDKEKDFLKFLNISNFQSKGSAGLKIGDICDSKAEIYFSFTDKIKQWDTCAAYCLITEAGGKMTDLNGEDLIFNIEILNHQQGLLVTNGVIHDLILDKLQEFLRFAKH
ncbi:MAG TPA: 3'(2'),5'-bisphosphate nucleotidase CysQ [Candidatus Nanoarchaeia archaeon]|nr:3'(2'),5'-bisphosphate nucleotidase CysQ [Candidatus Nanoarchaeia archaeon]